MLKNSNQEQAVGLLVNIDVDDLSKAMDFYRKAAGLRVDRRFGSLGVEMLGAISAIYLLGNGTIAQCRRPASLSTTLDASAS
jgi:predicted enzyme related to lactoylglutathione lyase